MAQITRGEAQVIDDDDGVRWLAMLARRVSILVVTEIERRYDLEPSLRTKQERQRREREQRAA
jgi:hypothetical protein